nr:ABC transporter permease [Halomonas sp.]
MIWRVLLTLLGHYRRHPGQLAMLLLGLWVASALWSSVQAVNATAKDSYARANALFSSDVDQLTRRDGAPLTRDDYLTLRRAGWPVSPLLEGSLQIGEQRLTVIGMDIFSLPANNALGSDAGASFTAFFTPPWQTQLAPETLNAMGISTDTAQDARPVTASGKTLPPLALRPDLPPNTLVMDIAAAAQLLDSGSELSQLVTSPNALASPPEGYRLTRAAAIASPGQLTDSFHLNLMALALLSLVVGLFIVQAALGLAMEQRMATLRTLRALGVPALTLVFAIALELLLLGLLGAGLGLISGLWLASQLLPDVATTLTSLYQADVSRRLALPWHYWLGSLGVTLGGLLLAGSSMLWRAARLDILALGQSQAWRQGYQRQLKRMLQGAMVSAVLAAGILVWIRSQPPGEGLLGSFALVATLLLFSALALPPLLNILLQGLQRYLHHRPLAHWAVADCQLQLPRLSLAMMALLIALATNLGVSSMVGGFRLTFLEWLDQRLAAPLYVNAAPSTLAPMLEWLDAQPEVTSTLPTAQGSSQLTPASSNAQAEQREIALFGIAPVPTLTDQWPLLETTSGSAEAWSAFSTGQSVFINEQLAVAAQLTPGDSVMLESQDGPVTVSIAAIYPDYGNPRGQLLMPIQTLLEDFSGELASLGLVLDNTVDPTTFHQALTERFDLSEEALINQQEVKELATRIFERTFTITRALNVLTLGVAALALLATLLAQARERQRQVAPLWAMGVSRRKLALLPLYQLGGLALLTAVAAIPLGIAITWVLVAIINVAAFGWRLPLIMFPWSIVATLATAVAVALLAAALPAIKLWRTSPRAILNEGST